MSTANCVLSPILLLRNGSLIPTTDGFMPTLPYLKGEGTGLPESEMQLPIDIE